MLKSFISFFMCLCILVGINGCTSGGASVVSAKDFSSNGGAAKASMLDKLAMDDDIEVSVEVDGRMEVSNYRVGLNHSGIVTLPLVGDVKIDKMNLAQAREVITKTYSAYFVNTPVVMISRVDDDVDGEWGFVTVTGRVGQPGRVKITSSNGMKLTSVIQASGGFGASAKKTEIRVSRKSEGGQKIQVTIDYTEIGQDGNIDADLDLRAGDIVYVPERMF